MEPELTEDHSVVPPAIHQSDISTTLPYSDGPPSYESILPVKTKDMSDPPPYLEINSQSLPKNSGNDPHHLSNYLPPNNQTLSGSNRQLDNTESNSPRNTNETSEISSAPPGYDINDPIPIATYQPEHYTQTTPPPYELNPSGMLLFDC